jgi:hypothetical protein
MYIGDHLELETATTQLVESDMYRHSSQTPFGLPEACILFDNECDNFF